MNKTIFNEDGRFKLDDPELTKFDNEIMEKVAPIAHKMLSAGYNRAEIIYFITDIINFELTMESL